MNRASTTWAEVWPISVLAIVLVLAGCWPGKENAVEPTQEPAGTEPQGLPTITPTPTPQHAVSPLPIPKSGQSISPLPTPEHPNGETAIEIPAQAADAVAWARADMAEQLGIPTDRIVVISIKAVQWRDSSLGCPRPGMMYAQVITPGYQFVLQSGETRYEYHSAQGSNLVVRCD
jgi:hypothetical protein